MSISTNLILKSIHNIIHVALLSRQFECCWYDPIVIATIIHVRVIFCM